MSFTVDVYPTKEEIISNESDLLCQRCGKRFSNASARRLHTVKTHGVLSSEGDRRIYERISDGLARTYIYHCPAEGCRKRELRFEGMRNLKQHYMRVHTEKSIKCRCGAMFALQKDLLYHQKKRCLLRDLRKSPAISEEVNAVPSSSETSVKKKKKYVKRVDRILNEIRTKKAVEMPAGTSSQQVIQPVILVVPSDNIAATVEAIKSVFRRTNETSVQVLPYECDPASTEKSTVAVGMDQPSCYDFSGQFNSPAPFFFPSSTCPNTANASSSTDQLVDFTHNATICYETQQASDVGFQYDYDGGVVRQARVRDRTTSTSMQYSMDEVYSGGPGQEVAMEAPLARTFGTMVNEKVFASVRNAETSMDAAEFDLLRDIETQTTLNDVGLMTDFWTDMGHSP